MSIHLSLKRNAECPYFLIAHQLIGNHFSLFQHGFSGEQLHIRRIAVLPQQPLYNDL